MANQIYSPAAQSSPALAHHMSQVFNYMVGGVALSGLVGWLTMSSPSLLAIAAKGNLIFSLIWLAFGMFLGPLVMRMQPTVALVMFVAFSALTGFALSPLVYLYTGASIISAFAIAAFMFAGASVYGYATQRSLSGWGNFLMMGMWGLIGAAVVNLIAALVFHHPIGGLSFVISLVAVPLFAGVTAWETNQIKENFLAYASDELLRSRLAILSATSLYMNFVTMFIHLLNLIGVARNNN